ncbi:hypothetical protein Q8G35_12570 [Peribacillus simplex]|uniref:Uncharacterized protein n=2 Tax=Peribacillus TaxID=2675229 RepID=A0AA90PEW9_9BACI|nr:MULTISPECIES: hypothetical protein [Peribacillus]MDP1419245.1 hypothetical protein [Peribacillus simplex]MDP1452117.1 hypothetical protein [Peribacillus frigoritolerans]
MSEESLQKELIKELKRTRESIKKSVIDLDQIVGNAVYSRMAEGQPDNSLLISIDEKLTKLLESK